MRNVGWAIEVARRHVIACHGFVSPCPSWRPHQTPQATRTPDPDRREREGGGREEADPGPGAELMAWRG